MLNLPQELLDLIFDPITARKDLKALTLVCRNFVSPGQCRLFHSLTLDMQTVADISRILSDRPHIGPYICDLHLNLHIGFDWDIHAPLAKLL
jgi:hypothetical protein